MHCIRGRGSVAVAALLMALVAIPSALAWNFAGHMTTAAICYDVLQQENPQALAAAVALLKQHPQYEKWAKQLEKVDEDNRDQALFMLAARWPDDIRGNPDYNHPEWHYIDYAYKPPGQPDSVATADPRDPNIETAFRVNIDILQGHGPAAEKAVALCWVMHLVGDGHQPLHTVSLFTKDHPIPTGDQGGNKEFIRAKAGGEPLKLHFFWDGLVSGSDDTRDIRKLAIELRNKYPQAELDPKPEAVTPADFADWI
jgi:S1/P1 Nuclease